MIKKNHINLGLVQKLNLCKRRCNQLLLLDSGRIMV